MRTKAGTTLWLGVMLLFLGCLPAAAQQQTRSKEVAKNTGEPTYYATAAEDKTANSKREETRVTSPTIEDRLKAMEQIIERQQCEIQTLRDMVEKKSGEATSVHPADATQIPSGQTQLATAANQVPAPGKSEASPPEAQKKIDELYKKFGAIRFSGDLRFRAETFRNQGFDAPTESPDRNRLRIRARVALDGTIDKHFDWGMRLATGFFTNAVSPNQTFTDFFERKPFALDRAFIRFDSKTDKVGVQLVAGKFEPTFRTACLLPVISLPMPLRTWSSQLNAKAPRPK